jgi:hypothetical protein
MFIAQITLFVPKPVIKEANVVMLLELEQDNCSTGNCEVNFIDHPIFNFTESIGTTFTNRRRIFGRKQ